MRSQPYGSWKAAAVLERKDHGSVTVVKWWPLRELLQKLRAVDKKVIFLENSWLACCCSAEKIALLGPNSHILHKLNHRQTALSG